MNHISLLVSILLALSHSASAGRSGPSRLGDSQPDDSFKVLAKKQLPSSSPLDGLPAAVKFILPAGYVVPEKNRTKSGSGVKYYGHRYKHKHNQTRTSTMSSVLASNSALYSLTPETVTPGLAATSSSPMPVAASPTSTPVDQVPVSTASSAASSPASSFNQAAPAANVPATLSSPSMSPSFSSSSPSASTTPASSSSSSGGNGAISDILAAHNTARASHGANPLVWSDELTALAKTWAEACVWEHGGANGAGQNLAAAGASGGSASQTGQQVVAGWMSEEKDYSSTNPQASHFTQVVWKASTQLGCYQARCSTFVDGTGKPVWSANLLPAAFTVCNYKTAGNVGGQYAANVQKAT